jgi:hypothetical protein
MLATIAHSLIVAQLQDHFPGLRATSHWVPGLKTVGLVFLLMLALQVPNW